MSALSRDALALLAYKLVLQETPRLSEQQVANLLTAQLPAGSPAVTAKQAHDLSQEGRLLAVQRAL